MKILIRTKGDKSVGLQGAWVYIEGMPDPLDAEDREDIRKSLGETFSELLAEPATVYFSDETGE